MVTIQNTNQEAKMEWDHSDKTYAGFVLNHVNKKEQGKWFEFAGKVLLIGVELNMQPDKITEYLFETYHQLALYEIPKTVDDIRRDMKYYIEFDEAGELEIEHTNPAAKVNDAGLTVEQKKEVVDLIRELAEEGLVDDRREYDIEDLKSAYPNFTAAQIDYFYNVIQSRVTTNAPKTR